MAKMKAFITTVDNPYNPSVDMQKWYMWDVTHGYNTSAYLARVTMTSDGSTDEENAEEIETAIDDIVRLDPFGIYKKLVREVPESAAI